MKLAGQRMRFATVEAARVAQRQLAALRDDPRLRARWLTRLARSSGADPAGLRRWRFFDLAALELRVLGTLLTALVVRLILKLWLLLMVP